MKNKLLTLTTLVAAVSCGKTKHVPGPVTQGPTVEVLVPVQPEAEAPVKCQVFTNLASPLLSQSNNTSKYLPLTHSVKGDIEIELDNMTLTEEPNDMMPFLEFLGTDASSVTKNFALRCKFQYEVTQAGNHTFYLTSDDGSQLFINGSRIIDNGGAHGMVLKSGSVTLPVGVHDMLILFYEGSGPKGLKLTVQPPAITQPVYQF